MEAFDADSYKDHKGDFNYEDEQLLLALLKSQPFKGRVLDVGSGDGKLTGLVKEALPHNDVSGIDNSPEQVALATTKFPNLLFQLADISNFNPGDTFEKIFSFYAFPHMPKSSIPTALKTTRSLLSKKGTFYLFTNIALFDTTKVPAQDQEACDVVFMDDFKSQINLISMEEAKEQFAQAGFMIIHDERRKTGAKIKNYGDMISWLFILN